MTQEILTGREIPISEIGNSFVITAKNNINGRIIFTDKLGHLKSYVLNKFQRNDFNMIDIVKNNHISFSPEFIEFRSDDGLESIIIDSK